MMVLTTNCKICNQKLMFMIMKADPMPEEICKTCKGKQEEDDDYDPKDVSKARYGREGQ